MRPRCRLVPALSMVGTFPEIDAGAPWKQTYDHGTQCRGGGGPPSANKQLSRSGWAYCDQDTSTHGCEKGRLFILSPSREVPCPAGKCCPEDPTCGIPWKVPPITEGAFPAGGWRGLNTRAKRRSEREDICQLDQAPMARHKPHWLKGPNWDPSLASYKQWKWQKVCPPLRGNGVCPREGDGHQEGTPSPSGPVSLPLRFVIILEKTPLSTPPPGVSLCSVFICSFAFRSQHLIPCCLRELPISQ